MNLQQFNEPQLDLGGHWVFFASPRHAGTLFLSCHILQMPISDVPFYELLEDRSNIVYFTADSDNVIRTLGVSPLFLFSLAHLLHLI